MAANKVIYGGNVLIDLTADSVTPDKLLTGATAHDMTGKKIEGSCTFDSDTRSATAKVAEVLAGSTFYARGQALVGTMPNNAGIGETIDNKDDEIVVPIGYHDGSGVIKIDTVEKAKIIPENIKQGVTVLGVVGSLEPSSAVTAQGKSVTPSPSPQTVLPDSGYDYLSQVVVRAIPYVEVPNSAGGTTVTIGG